MQTSKTFQVGIPDFLFLCIQYGSYGIPVSGIYLYAGMAWAGTGGNRIYVAAKRTPHSGGRFYLESVGGIMYFEMQVGLS